MRNLRAALSGALLSCVLVLATIRSVPAADGLGFVEVHQDGVRGVDGLKGAQAAAVSPDGTSVYVASQDDDAIAVFRRDPATGTLTFVERERDGSNGVDGLDGAKAVIVSPDGLHVYAVANRDDAVAAFRRNRTTGALVFLERQRDNVDGVDGLDGADGLAVSPDGAYLYVTASQDRSVAVFRRNPSTGALAFVEVTKDGTGLVTGLAGARGIALSPDGAHVYVTGNDAAAVAVFQRDAASGRLQFVERKKNGVDGIDGIDGAAGIAVSPDGASVYVAGKDEDAVAVFQRDATTGVLTFVAGAVQRDGVGGVDGLDGIDALVPSPDGSLLYAGGSDDSAVAVFRRDPTTGRLAFVGRQHDGAGTVNGLDGLSGLAVSPDGRNVYVAGTDDDALAVLSALCGNGVVDAGEQCDQGDGLDGDGCSAGCRIECTAPFDCDDGDSCTEERCRQGECARPRCGFDGGVCRLNDALATLDAAPACGTTPRPLHRAIRARLREARRLVRRVGRRKDAEARVKTLVKRVGTTLDRLQAKVDSLERRHVTTSACADAITTSVTALGDDLRDMLQHRAACAS